MPVKTGSRGHLNLSDLPPTLKGRMPPVPGFIPQPVGVLKSVEFMEGGNSLAVVLCMVLVSPGLRQGASQFLTGCANANRCGCTTRFMGVRWNPAGIHPTALRRAGVRDTDNRHCG